MPRILLLDESSPHREELVVRLSDAGYEVAAVEEPQAAAAELRERKPDLMILNILHPGFNTLAFLSSVRQDPANEGLKVLVLSLTVWAERLAGPSSWVSDYLPKPVPLDVLEKACAKALGGGLEGKNVLLAEDDEMMAMMVKHFLETRKARVHVVADGYQVVRAAQGGGADLLLLDIMLPGLNGFEILKVLKEGPTNLLPVIIVSAMRLNAYQKKGLLTGEPEIIARMVPTEFILERAAELLRAPSL